MAIDGRDGLTVLVLEDNPGDVALARDHLRSSGGIDTSVRILEARTLEEALAHLDASAVDAALVDLDLPDSTGLATLEAIVEADPSLPVIVLTGHEEADLGREAVRRGAQDFFPKAHLGPGMLHRALRHAMERARTETAIRDAERSAREAYERAEDSVRLLRTTLDGLDDAVLVTEEGSGRILDCNRAAESIFGHPREELIGRTTERLHVGDEDTGTPGREGRSGVDGEEMVRRQRTMVRADGSVFPVEHVVNRLETPPDLPARLVEVVRDLSDEEKRRRRIRFQAALLDQVGQAVVATDRDGTVRYWNRAAERIYGWRREEALGRPILDLTPAEESRGIGKEIMDAVLAGETWTGDFPVRRKDGSTFYALVTNAPVLDDDGAVAGIIGVSSDITDRVRIQEDLDDANRALRVVSGANRVVVESVDEEDLLRRACRVAVEEGGYPLAWIGYAEKDPDRTIRLVASHGPARDYLDGIDLAWADAGVGKGPAGSAIRSGTPVVSHDLETDEFFTFREEALSHGLRSVLAIPLLTTEGDPIGVLVVYAAETDAFDAAEVEILSELGADLAHGIGVHRRRAREAELQARLGEAEKLRAVGQLAGGVAHDFNNYLSVVVTLTDLLLEDHGLEEGVIADLRQIRSAAESSALLTRQLLTFGRRDTRRPVALDPNEVVRETLDMLGPLLGEELEVVVDLTPELDAVRMDRGRLTQVLLNLAINGRDAMASGGRLTFRSERVSAPDEGEGRAGRIVISVSDTGVGMDEETCHRIFEPFFSTKETGTGLGLATVYGIVTEAGGEIEVESEPGVGTTMRVTLPTVDAEPDAADSEGPGEDGRAGSETILLIEDQEAVRRVTRRVLERYGYEVVEAGSVAEAIRLGTDAERTIDVVLSDVRLPDGSGPDAVGALREARADLPVIFTSGYPREELDAPLLEELGGRFVQKPFEPAELGRAVRAALDDA